MIGYIVTFAAGFMVGLACGIALITKFIKDPPEADNEIDRR